MNQDELYQLLKNRNPEQDDLRATFIRYQAAHFSLRWEELLNQFLVDRGEVGKIEPKSLSLFDAFIEASKYPASGDLSEFVRSFGQAGLVHTKLSQEEKDSAVSLAIYNLASHYGVFMDERHNPAISLDYLVEDSRRFNFINVCKVGNNIANRIQKDYEEFSREYQKALLPKGLFFQEELGFEVAYVEGEAVSRLDRKDYQVEYLLGYTHLPILTKSQIIMHFDEVKETARGLLRPAVSLGEFDEVRQSVPVYLESRVVAYIGADGGVQEIQPVDTNVMAEVQALARNVRVGNMNQLLSLGISLDSFELEQQKALLDAVGRYRFPESFIKELANPAYPAEKMAFTMEAVDSGLDVERGRYFLTSQFSISQNYGVVAVMLEDGLTLEQVERYEMQLEDMTISARGLAKQLRQWQQEVGSLQEVKEGFDEIQLTPEQFEEPEALHHQSESDNVSRQDFTSVLDAAYNVGQPRELGILPPEEFIPAWNRFYDWFDRLGSLEAVVSEATEQGYLDMDSNFYREYQEDRQFEKQELAQSERRMTDLESSMSVRQERLRLQSITMEWSELTSETDKHFAHLQDLQDFIFQHFMRSKEEVERFVSEGGISDYYDKTKLHFDFENSSGQLYRLTTRIGVGFGQGAFNPYLQTIKGYLYQKHASELSQHNLLIGTNQEVILQEHHFPEAIVSLLNQEQELNRSYYEYHVFESVEEAYRYGSHSRDFKSLFPRVESYIAYLSQPYPLLENEIKAIEEATTGDILVSLNQEFPVLSTSPDISELSTKYSDFSFPEDLENFYPRTPVERVNANIEAIALLKKLEKEEVQATPEQQTTLAKYVGWGGLANEFFDEHNPKFGKQREALRALVTDKEYSDMKISSLTAYYTDPAIIREMFRKLENDGFTGGRILDPSMGTGNFFAAMPKEMRERSQLYGVELDGITGSIARQLHPNAQIQIKGFEETDFNNGAFDLVISNIPFANVRIADNRYKKPYMIHDYFVKRSMDLLRDGGQLSVISSTGTLDKRTGNVLQDIEANTQFLGGVRLPDTAFRKIAGTSVTTDILYFQKDERKLLHEESKFNQLVFEPAMQLPEDHRVWVNPFFGKVEADDNPFVLGEFEVKNFNGGTLSLKARSENLVDEIQVALEQTVSAFPIEVSTIENVFPNVAVKQSIPEGLAEDMALYSFAYVGDTIYYRDTNGIRVGSKIEEISYYVNEEGEFQSWDSSISKAKIQRFRDLGVTEENALDVYQAEEAASRGKNKGNYKKTIFFESPLSGKEIERIRGMVDIREAYQAVIDIQRDMDYDAFEFEGLLMELNQVYDRFVSKFSFLNQSVNRNLFDEDDKYSLLASLEDEYIDPQDKKVKYSKSLVFERALIRPKRELKEVHTAQDALNTSLAEGRGVDFGYMMSVYKDRTEDDIIAELGTAILPNPQATLEGRTEYISRNHFLSGDVVDRLDQIERLIEQGNVEHDWETLKSMLEAVRPVTITLTDIDYRIGSRWIPESVYGMFAYHMFTNQNRDRSVRDAIYEQVLVTNPIDNRLSLASNFDYNSSSILDRRLGVLGSRYNSGRKIFENLLNGNQPAITKTIEEDGQQHVVTDMEKTADLRSKEEEIQGLFREFVHQHSEVEQVIQNTYNHLFNRTVTREYDGSSLEIDGLASNIELRDHQKNAIQRVIEEKRALLAHEVGSGKTLTMLGAGFKLKELGMIHKPLYVVPSSLTAQFGQEIMKFFPTKNVFVTTRKDFVKAKRKQFISRIITGDYDAIVIGDSQFEKIPMSREKRLAFISDKLEELRSLKEATDRNERSTIKQIEQSVKSFEIQLEELQNLAQDSFIEFENLGIDMLFVDEAHHFKNIRPVTSLGNVAGITNQTSKKNVDMEMKVRQIQSEHDHRNVVFATGTPVSNSISEMYTMMSYIQPDVLRKHQIDRFDAWVGAFGNIENSMELTPTGDRYQSKKRFKKFVNLPELMKIYKETTDIQTADMLNLPVPEVEVIPVESELTDSQKEYLTWLVNRSDAIKAGSVDPSEDNMLKITSEARKLAIDMRLLDTSYGLSDNNKLMQVVDNVERIYREGMDREVTQMIFSDIGTPKSKTNLSTFDVYHELKELLAERGIPKEQIAFVHDADTDTKKNALSRKVNAGEIRILLASTEKGGTGLNVQRKMKAVHHLDVPWRPSDVGRILRTFKIKKNVEVTDNGKDNF